MTHSPALDPSTSEQEAVEALRSILSLLGVESHLHAVLEIRRMRDELELQLLALGAAEGAVEQLCEGQDKANECWATLDAIRHCLVQKKR